MKKKLNIAFVGFGTSLPIEERLIYKSIAQNYDIHQCSDPDYVILQGTSFWEHHNYNNSIKILLNGENYVADFNAFDYAIGFDLLNFGDRYLRSPLFVHYRCFHDLINRKTAMTDQWLLNREFCSFIVSHAKFDDPMRRKFFAQLSKYKPVASGGRYMNNVGGPVKDKIDFCRHYKFNIAFENSASPGYTTEKIMEAYAAQTVPIYFGNPLIEKDFRLESMIRVKDEDDIDRAIDEIIRLDNDDAAYLAKCHERCFAVSDPTNYERQLEEFLVHIFEQPLESARRRNRYGYQAVMNEHLRKLMKIDHMLCGMRDRISRISHILWNRS